MKKHPMDTNSLTRILQKAEECKKHSKNASRQEQTDESLLERIRQRAEEQETLNKRHLDWQDKIQAIQETYGLSEKEIAAILQEVEQENQKAASSVPPSLFQKLFSRFFSPKGRIGRGTFFVSILAVFVFQGVCGGLAFRGAFPFGLLALVGIYSQLIVSIKRFHDLNKSGLFSILTFIPLLNFFAYIYLLFFKGTPGPNAFGDEEPPPQR